MRTVGLILIVLGALSLLTGAVPLALFLGLVGWLLVRNSSTPEAAQDEAAPAADRRAELTAGERPDLRAALAAGPAGRTADGSARAPVARRPVAPEPGRQHDVGGSGDVVADLDRLLGDS